MHLHCLVKTSRRICCRRPTNQTVFRSRAGKLKNPPQCDGLLLSLCNEGRHSARSLKAHALYGTESLYCQCIHRSRLMKNTTFRTSYPHLGLRPICAKPAMIGRELSTYTTGIFKYQPRSWFHSMFWKLRCETRSWKQSKLSMEEHGLGHKASSVRYRTRAVRHTAPNETSKVAQHSNPLPERSSPN